MREVATSRRTRGYAALAHLEKMCSLVQFQEPKTKLWLFDTLVTPTLLYGVQIWGPSLNHRTRLGGTLDGWRKMEKPLVTLIAKLIRCKASVQHEIVRAELGAAPIVVEALTKSVSYIHSLWNLPSHRYVKLALESSCQLAREGDSNCWYEQMSAWFQLNGFTMDRLDRLPPFQYSLDAPMLTLTRQEINKTIRQDLTQLETKRSWLTPSLELGKKMAFYKDHFLTTTEDGFI
ncbi:hypothetical protein L7F22_062742 [Adiantum nelumboides]|nr:hypothetical protein [Adiantum nelumboides]